MQRKFSPEILLSCKNAISKSILDLDFQRLDKDSFGKCENIPIDIAVMEKTSRGVVIPLDVGWSDIGSWEVVWDTSEKDLDGNSTEGKVILENSKNSEKHFLKYLRNFDKISSESERRSPKSIQK